MGTLRLTNKPMKLRSRLKGLRRKSSLKRQLYLLLAVVSIGLAILGVILPGLPAFEFVLLAAWASARSSERLHDWIMSHRWFGPMLRNWRDHRVVSNKTKLAAAVSMGCALLLAAWSFSVHSWAFSGIAAGITIGLIWLLLLPASPAGKPELSQESEQSRPMSATKKDVN